MAFGVTCFLCVFVSNFNYIKAQSNYKKYNFNIFYYVLFSTYSLGKSYGFYYQIIIKAQSNYIKIYMTILINIFTNSII